VLVGDDRDAVRHHALIGLRRFVGKMRAAGRDVSGDSLDQLMAASDAHVGTPDEVIASLRADRTLDRATDIAFQVHPMDPPHADIMRSIELVAEQVAPALGWRRQIADTTRLAVAS
jgi:alkanesulfonate monooxygenase SsuD/methylene tetrahydromethanopterin reductase-like flavin-dependent oxidoreductase (luciferase family)